MALGIVGGATRVSDGAGRAQNPRVQTARESAEIVASVGLAQNSPRPALATEGIQKGTHGPARPAGRHGVSLRYGEAIERVAEG